MTLSIGWFSSGRDEAARNLLLSVYDDIRSNNWPARIEWIFCHRETGDGPFNEEYRQRELFFDLAAQLDIPVACFSHMRFLPDLRKQGLKESPSAAEPSPALAKWRDLYGLEVIKTVRMLPPVNIVVMAGYMLIIGAPELEQLELVNIHPALPWGPRGTWQEVIHQLIAQRAQEQGIMIHLVTEVLDRGPVISYCRFPIQGPAWDELWLSWDEQITPLSSRETRENHPLFRQIRQYGEVRELPLLNRAIRELALAAISVRDKKVFAGGRLLEQGIDLTEEIERAVG
uniref:phosphoribosylglycinamide formyltransferase 1 n=1 Tax=Desulfomonile tiedjei TaxID=2358 RepID=A0A7C4ASG1_9BACT